MCTGSGSGSTPATSSSRLTNMSTGSGSGSGNGSSQEVKYRGVRLRKWGKWVSEVRLPNSRDRIWLGSYDSPEKAARAFDAAAFCLRGSSAQLNFPNDPPSVPSAGGGGLSHQEIQAIVAQHAHAAAIAAPPESAASESTAPPEQTTDALLRAVDWSFLDYGFEFVAQEELLQGDASSEEEEGGSSSYLWNF